jgi:hypothetical protein
MFFSAPRLNTTEVELWKSVLSPNCSGLGQLSSSGFMLELFFSYQTCFFKGDLKILTPNHLPLLCHIPDTTFIRGYLRGWYNSQLYYVSVTILGPLAFERGRGRSHSKGGGLGGFSLSLSRRHEISPHQRCTQERHLSKLLIDKIF